MYIYIYTLYRRYGFHLSTNCFEILRGTYALTNICVFVSSNWGHLAVSFKRYPWNPPGQGEQGVRLRQLPGLTQSYTSKGIGRQGIRSFCKEFPSFNAMPCRPTPLLAHYRFSCLQVCRVTACFALRAGSPLVRDDAPVGTGREQIIGSDAAGDSNSDINSNNNYRNNNTTTNNDSSSNVSSSSSSTTTTTNNNNSNKCSCGGLLTELWRDPRRRLWRSPTLTLGLDLCFSFIYRYALHGHVYVVPWHHTIFSQASLLKEECPLSLICLFTFQVKQNPILKHHASCVDLAGQMYEWLCVCMYIYIYIYNIMIMFILSMFTSLTKVYV